MSEGAFKPSATRHGLQNLLMVAAFLVAALGFMLTRPEKVFDAGWLNTDNGMALSTVDQLLAGKTLYQDAFSPYGPLTTYYYYGAAAILGNSPVTYLLSTALVYGAAFWLGIRFIRRHCQRWPATALGITALGAFLWRTWGSTTHNRLYVPWEMLILFLVALLWQPPGQRTKNRLFLTGLLIGLLQWVKFGDAVAAGASWLTTDVLYLAFCNYRNPADNRPRLNLAFIFSWWPLAAGFALMETLRTAVLYLFLPLPVFKDVFFPAFMVEHYKASYDREWTTHTFVDAGVFFNYQLPILVALLAGVVGLVKLFAGRLRNTGPDLLPVGVGAAVFLLGFYLYGDLLLFRQKWLAYEYAWALLLPLGVFLELAGNYLLVLAAVSLAVLMLSVPAKFLPGSKIRTVKTVFPDGQVLYLEPKEKAAWEGLNSSLDSLPHHGQVIVCLQHPHGISAYGTGLYHFAGRVNPTRHNWYLPKWVRPYEEADIAQQVLSSDGIVFRNFKSPPRDYTSATGWQDFDWSPLAAASNAKIRDSFELHASVNNDWIVLSPISTNSGAVSSHEFQDQNNHAPQGH